MLSSSTFLALCTRGSPARLVLAFAAGLLAVPVFHQVVLLLLHVAGVVPITPPDRPKISCICGQPDKPPFCGHRSCPGFPLCAGNMGSPA